MDALINDFLNFLSEEYSYLVKIKVFLVNVPQMITGNKINEVEFQAFLEKYEVETSRYVFERKRFKDQIAQKLNIPAEQVNFTYLVRLGYREFDEKARRVLRITNDINQLLFKIAIFLRNFHRLQQEFKRLNSFLYQHDYTSRGQTVASAYTPGKNFYGEA